MRDPAQKYRKAVKLLGRLGLHRPARLVCRLARRRCPEYRGEFLVLLAHFTAEAGDRDTSLETLELCARENPEGSRRATRAGRDSQGEAGQARRGGQLLRTRSLDGWCHQQGVPRRSPNPATAVPGRTLLIEKNVPHNNEELTRSAQGRAERGPRS